MMLPSLQLHRDTYYPTDQRHYSDEELRSRIEMYGLASPQAIVDGGLPSGFFSNPSRRPTTSDYERTVQLLNHPDAPFRG